MTGLPVRLGLSSTSTAAKNASMSTCRTVGIRLRSRSSTEGQPAETLGEAGAGPLALLLGAMADGLADQPLLLVELGAMALDRGGLGLDGVGDIDPFVGLEGARQQHGGHLVRWPGVWEVERGRSGGRDGVEQGGAGDAVVAVIEIGLPEEES